MTDIKGTPGGESGQTNVLYHDEGDGTYSEAKAAHIRLWDTTDGAWNRASMDHTTGGMKVYVVGGSGTETVTVTSGSLTANQGTAGTSPWPVSVGGSVNVAGTVTAAGSVQVTNTVLTSIGAHPVWLLGGSISTSGTTTVAGSVQVTNTVLASLGGQVNVTQGTTPWTASLTSAVIQGAAGTSPWPVAISSGSIAQLPVSLSSSGALKIGMQSARTATGYYLGTSGRQTVLSFAHAATVGVLWLALAPGSTGSFALRRVSFNSTPVAATPFASAPRVTMELMTFTGSLAASSITSAKRRTSDGAPNHRAMTAMTAGTSLTAGAVVCDFFVPPVLTAAGAVEPVRDNWQPVLEDDAVVIAAGEGVVFRQPDAGGVASDTRVYTINYELEEFSA